MTFKKIVMVPFITAAIVVVVASVAFACTQTVDYNANVTVSPTSGTQNSNINLTCGATNVAFSSNEEMSCFFLDEGVSAQGICVGTAGGERYVAGYDNPSGGVLSASGTINVGSTGGTLARLCWISVFTSDPTTPNYIRATDYTTFNVVT